MLGMFLNTQPMTLTPEIEAAIAEDVRRSVTLKHGDKLLRPGDEIKTQIAVDIREAVTHSLQVRSLRLSTLDETTLIEKLIAQITGLGFLDAILAAGNVIEIAGNPDGSWWIVRRGESEFTPLAIRPSPIEVRTVLDKILGPLGRRVTEAEPIVIGKLPPSPSLPAGARLNIVAAPIANGPYPAVNLRFYEDQARHARGDRRALADAESRSVGLSDGRDSGAGAPPDFRRHGLRQDHACSRPSPAPFRIRSACCCAKTPRKSFSIIRRWCASKGDPRPVRGSMKCRWARW